MTRPPAILAQAPKVPTIAPNTKPVMATAIVMAAADSIAGPQPPAPKPNSWKKLAPPIAVFRGPPKPAPGQAYSGLMRRHIERQLDVVDDRIVEWVLGAERVESHLGGIEQLLVGDHIHGDARHRLGGEREPLMG